MLIQQKNDPSVISHHTDVQMLAGAEGVVEVKKPGIALRIGTALDPGIERKLRPNEDTLSVTHDVITAASSKPFVLLIVSDGMGGQGHGQEASRLAVGSLTEYVAGSLCSKQATSQTFLTLLKAGVQYANRVVYQRNQEQRTEMGTTLTASLVVDTTAYVAHVGDSRCYLYREPGGLLQITHDHSLVAALVTAGVIQPEDIYTHPRRNLIYRCLGEKASVEVDAIAVPLVAGDILLFCSDGLWEMVRDQQIAAILTSPMPDPAQTAHALLQAALAGGGEDNVSVIVVQVGNV
jgi:serine/threonine protein phosphatase PrpC